LGEIKLWPYSHVTGAVDVGCRRVKGRTVRYGSEHLARTEAERTLREVDPELEIVPGVDTR
jgi:hypothetical protein